MSAELLIANLLRVAKEDLEGARLLSPQLNRNAIYLCEQAAEKIIRAVLTSEGKHAGIRHELRDMVNLVPDENPVKPALRAMEHLAAYATSYRYPTVSGRITASPGKPILEEAASKVETALGMVSGRLGVDLAKPNTPAIHLGPIR